MCRSDPSKWESAYNLGRNDCTYTLVEVANWVKETLKKHGISDISISLEKRDIKTYAGMDSTKITALTGWIPQYDIEDIIETEVTKQLKR